MASQKKKQHGFCIFFVRPNFTCFQTGDNRDMLKLEDILTNRDMLKRADAVSLRENIEDSIIVQQPGLILKSRAKAEDIVKRIKWAEDANPKICEVEFEVHTQPIAKSMHHRIYAQPSV